MIVRVNKKTATVEVYNPATREFSYYPRQNVVEADRFARWFRKTYA